MGRAKLGGGRPAPGFSLEKALKAQKELSKLVSERSCFKKLEVVAGVDAAYLGQLGVGAAVAVDCSTLEPLKKATALLEVKIPYVPTFLAFRELPVMLKALRKLGLEPDAVIVDGHGLAHPRRFGLACHLGLILNKPTVGVAKKRLYGREEGGFLRDEEGRAIGAVVEVGGKKIYVSVGNKISLMDAVNLVKRLTRRGLPEPLRLAHEEASRRRLELRG